MKLFSGKYKTILLLILFILLILGGRYLFFDKTVQQKSQTSVATSTQSLSREEENTNKSNTTIVKDEPTPPLSCIDQWKKKVSDEKINYDRGSILVGFVAGVSLDQAIQTLGTHGVVIRDMQYARENYDSRRLVTASVKSGEEFSKLCSIKKDASVRYAGLNVLFELHE